VGSLVERMSTHPVPRPLMHAFLWVRQALRRCRSWLTPANADLIERTFAIAEARALGIAAELDLAERLAGGPLLAGALAAATGVEPNALERLLQVLATAGYFRQDRAGRWRNTRLSEVLRSAHPLSVRAWARFFGGGEHFRIWGQADAAIRSGQSATRALTGHDFFEWSTRVAPEAGRLFDAAMLDGSRFVGPSFARSVDLHGVASLCDVGGGTGRLLAEVLSAKSSMRGVLFDLPEVVAGAASVLEAAGVAERVEVVGGSFFERVPPGLDRYVLTSVVHDWGDAQATAILRSCRDALAASSRVLVVEQVLEPGRAPLFERHSDLLMLVLAGSGRERTDAEFRRLFSGAGLSVTRTFTLATLQRVYELAAAAA
jgi:hypothetical protein